jgi:hypothetical protein
LPSVCLHPLRYPPFLDSHDTTNSLLCIANPFLTLRLSLCLSLSLSLSVSVSLSVSLCHSPCLCLIPICLSLSLSPCLCLIPICLSVVFSADLPKAVLDTASTKFSSNEIFASSDLDINYVESILSLCQVSYLFQQTTPPPSLPSSSGNVFICRFKYEGSARRQCLTPLTSSDLLQWDSKEKARSRRQKQRSSSLPAPAAPVAPASTPTPLPMTALPPPAPSSTSGSSSSSRKRTTSPSISLLPERQRRRNAPPLIPLSSSSEQDSSHQPTVTSGRRHNVQRRRRATFDSLITAFDEDKGEVEREDESEGERQDKSDAEDQEDEALECVQILTRLSEHVELREHPEMNITRLTRAQARVTPLAPQPEPGPQPPPPPPPQDSQPPQVQSSSSIPSQRPRRGRYSALYDDLYEATPTPTPVTEPLVPDGLTETSSPQEAQADSDSDPLILTFLPNRSRRAVRIGSSYQVENIPSTTHPRSSTPEDCTQDVALSETQIWSPSLASSSVASFNYHSYLQRASSLVTQYCLTLLTSQPSHVAVIYPSNHRVLTGSQLQIDGSYLPVSSSYEDIFLEALYIRSSLSLSVSLSLYLCLLLSSVRLTLSVSVVSKSQLPSTISSQDLYQRKSSSGHSLTSATCTRISNRFCPLSLSLCTLTSSSSPGSGLLSH